MELRLWCEAFPSAGSKLAGAQWNLEGGESGGVESKGRLWEEEETQVRLNGAIVTRQNCPFVWSAMC